MSLITPATVTRPLRRARSAVATLFFLNAVLYANLVPRLPEVKSSLGLGNAELGYAVAAMPTGSLAAGLLAPLLIRRLGSARLAAGGVALLALAVAGIPFAEAWLALALLMFLVGALDAVVDVAQNAHGFRVQRAYGRSIINSLHAVWSIGAVVGGLLGAGAVALAIPLGPHLAGSAVVFAAVAVVAYRHLLPGPEDTERAAEDGVPPAPAVAGTGRVAGRAVLLLGVLGVLASAEAFVQDAGSTWGALYMRSEVGSAAATAGFAFVALQVAMTLGRLVGDRVTDRFGQRRVVRVGGLVTALGMALATLLPTVPTTVLGFGLAGLGVATLVPAVMHTADELTGLPDGVGLTVVSWLLRVGFLLSPVVIGVTADATSLRLALGTVVLAGLSVLVLGRVLSRPTTTTPGGTT